MKTIILYRTALLAKELGKKYQSTTAEWKYLNKIVEDFNYGEHNSLGEDIDTYSVVQQEQ